MDRSPRNMTRPSQRVSQILDVIAEVAHRRPSHPSAVRTARMAAVRMVALRRGVIENAILCKLGRELGLGLPGFDDLLSRYVFGGSNELELRIAAYATSRYAEADERAIREFFADARATAVN